MSKCRVLVRRFACAALAWSGLAVFGGDAAWAQAPGVTRISPGGAAPGSKVDITLFGGNLAGATRLWTSFPATATLPTDIADNGKQADRVVFRVEIPADVPPQVGGIRVATDKGVSDLKLFVIDDLPNVLEVEPNNSPGEPQAISVPVAVTGTMDPEQFDYYKLSAKQGQTLAFEVIARRMGSPLDPMVRLLDLQGRELTYNDDSEGAGSDSRFTYTFPADGDYLLEVRDIRFQGGGDYVYRLRVGDFPIATAPYPMGGKRGSQIELALAGPYVQGTSAQKVKVPAEPAAEQITLGAKAAGGQASTFVGFAIGDSAEALEAEPNNLPDQPTRVVLPAAMNGRLDRPGDQDHWVFSAAKGQRFIFEAITRSLGSPSDLFLTLYNAQGAVVSTADDAGTADAVLDFTFPEDGDYRLVVEDLNRRGGPEYVYRIAVRPYQPGFRLVPSAQKVDIPQGGVATLTVTVQRQDYGGPIALRAEGLPEGITASPSVIAAGQNQAFLTLTAADNVAPGQLLVWRVVGSADIGGKKVERSIDMTDVLRTALANTPYPPQPLVRDLGAGTGPKPFFTLRTEPQVFVVGRNVTTAVTVKAQRAEGFKDPITLKVDGLPGQVTAEIKPIEAEKDTAQIVFKANPDAPLQVFTALITGSGKFNNQDLSQPAPAVNLDIRMAFELKAEVGEGKLARGNKLAVKVTAARHGGFNGPITLELRNLPNGVKPATELVIPQDKNELEIQLAAADDAQVGAAGNIVVAGKADVSGAAQEVASSAVTITVLEKQ